MVSRRPSFTIDKHLSGPSGALANRNNELTESSSAQTVTEHAQNELSLLDLLRGLPDMEDIEFVQVQLRPFDLD